VQGEAAEAAALAERRAAIDEKLAATEQARQEAVDRRRQVAELQRDEAEDVDKFLASFEAEVGVVQAGIAEGAALAGHLEQAGAHFDELSQRAAALNERLSSAAMFLPSYQLRQRQQALSALAEEVAMARAKAVPKKKFAFSKRKKAAGAKKAAPEPAPEPEPVAEPEAEEFDSAYLVTQLSGETLCKTAGEIAAHDYAITDVSDCTIYLMDVIGALYIKRVKNCRIVCGPTRGSVHLDDVHDSSISLAARQVRVHKSTECKLHIFCASDPIIEHCSGIGIGSYALDYDGIAAHTKVSSRSTFVQRCRAVGHGPPASCTLTPASVLACSPRSWRPWQTAGAEFRTSTGCVRRSRRIGTLWTRVPMLQKRSCVPKISLLYAGHRS
jgi:cell division septation protein DedD